MKLAEHVEKIRIESDRAIRNILGRMGITESGIKPMESVPADLAEDRKRIETVRDTLVEETGSIKEGYEKLVEEFTFTLFNRIAALKVMEAHRLHPEIITKRVEQGNRSFAHRLWLEQNPDGRAREFEGLKDFIGDKLKELSGEIPLFAPDYPYHLLPTTIELNKIIEAFNAVEKDEQIEAGIWKNDDILGWLYESYNNSKKIAFKESGKKTEYDKVSIQSQVYTPRWVVKFLVDNSLGKLYLEMFPDSRIKEKYKIANVTTKQIRDAKPLSEIRMLDPVTGSGNFLLYGFDLFYDLYFDQIENYGADYNKDKIPELIIQHNLFGVDLDDRAVQLAQFGMYIKAKLKKSSFKAEHFNIVSTDFYLPEYKDIKYIFSNGESLPKELEDIVISVWDDLRQAHKFGTLIRIEEVVNQRLEKLSQQFQQPQISFAEEQTLASYDEFRENFFTRLKQAVESNARKLGKTFLNTKTHDAFTFLEMMTQKYDVTAANPPYTDSSDFGVELKKFVDTNYKKPYKFNTNLYATFISKCIDLATIDGKVALVHPPTFMYIKTFEDVREYIVSKTKISLFVEWGYLGMFNPLARVDSAMYVLDKRQDGKESIFIKLNDLYEGHRFNALFESYNELISGVKNDRVYFIDQSKLKIIDGWPFIYWISDGFREKFNLKTVSDYLKVCSGLTTGNNDRFMRYWWEVDKNTISSNVEKKKWFYHTKGGTYNKWYGNIWLVLNWQNDGFELKNFLDEYGNLRSVIRNEEFYFKEGITYPDTGSKGVTFRVLNNETIIGARGPGIFNLTNDFSTYYALGFLNSKLSFYVADCLNPTVSTSIADIQKIPFVKPPQHIEDHVSILAIENVVTKRKLNSFRIIETNYDLNPILAYSDTKMKDRLLMYLNFENAQTTQVLLNEAIINQLIFKVYDLREEDRQQVETKMGKPVGELPVLDAASKSFLSEHTLEQEIAKEHIASLGVIQYDGQQVQSIKSEFGTFYQSNNDLEEFCIRHQVNPINVWYWFKESKILPAGIAHDITMEFLADSFRTLLMQDEDGIIPLTGTPEEAALLERFEKYCIDKGFTESQIGELDELLGKPLKEYIEQLFFKRFSDHLNLFMYLPKTPFIWHLSSGENQGFEAYIVIYKWNRDSLYKLKSKYLSKRSERLQHRQMELVENNSAQAQTEKEIIRLQLEEIEKFESKIDELIAEEYDPKLDDGVGKNIAPLQKKGMLKCDVLNSKQLERYLNADW